MFRKLYTALAELLKWLFGSHTYEHVEEIAQLECARYEPTQEERNKLRTLRRRNRKTHAEKRRLRLERQRK